jgi:hypothetical protein
MSPWLRSIHEAGHALMAYHLPHTSLGRSSLFFTDFYPKFSTDPEIQQDIVKVLLSGSTAEELVFGQYSYSNERAIERVYPGPVTREMRAWVKDFLEKNLDTLFEIAQLLYVGIIVDSFKIRKILTPPFPKE